MKGMLIHTVMVIAQGVDLHAPAVARKSTKSSPGYDEYYPDFRVVCEWEPFVSGGIRGEIRVKSLRGECIVAEAATSFNGETAATILSIKALLHESAMATVGRYGPLDLREEFTFYCVTEYGDLEREVDENRPLITQLVKDETATLTDFEIDSAFAGSVRYEPDDLAVIDWDGAVLFDHNGEFDDEIALLELANVQLLSLRSLDGTLSREIGRFSTEVAWGAAGVWRLSRTLRSIVGVRAKSLVELDAIGDSMRLYGEWYDAKMYALAARKLSLEKWRATVAGKLATLEKMFEMVSTLQGELYNIILEITIIALIVLEIILALTGSS